MKLASLLVLTFLAAKLPADRLILAPTAHALPNDTFRVESWFGGEPDRFGAAFVAASYGGFEAQYRWVNLNGHREPGALDIAFDYLSPIGDISPGLSAGVMDVANVTSDGRREYVCATMNRSSFFGLRNGFTELTAGFAVGRKSGPYAGIRAPIAKNLSWLGEYDGIRFSTGVQLNLWHSAYMGVDVSEGSAFLTVGGRF